MIATSGQYDQGSGVKPSALPAQVKGSAMPTMLMTTVVAMRAALARLSMRAR